MARYRSRSRILLDVLHAVDGHNVTGMLRAANLSHPRLKEILDEASTRGWVQENEGGWRLTDEGRRVRAELQRVARQMADFGLEF